MDAIFFEKVLIKFLFTNEKVRDKAVPFLNPVIFEDQKNLQLIKTALAMNDKFEKFPTVPEMRIELKTEDVYKRLIEIMEMDISEYQTEFLLEEIEEFIRNKLVHNINVEIAMSLNNDKQEELKQAPDNLREAIAFSFDTKIGLDFLEDEERLYNHLHNKDRVISTSFSVLNKAIEGGFHCKSLTLFMAETNLGKSLIITSIGVDCILKNKNVLYVTCEMSEEKISERVMSNIFDIDSEDLLLLSRNKFHEKFEKIRKQVNNKLVIKEYPPRAISANHIRNLVKELKVRKKFTPDVIFIDYIGIMNPIYKNKGDNSYLEVKRISEEVRALAVELGLPIVSAVQTNRGGFGDAEIDLTDISDSIGTAATADVIIGVTQSEEMRTMGKFVWIILKNRYGINKKKIEVNVDYYKMRVYEDPSSELNNTNKTITKDGPKGTPQNKNGIPSSEKDKEKNINETTEMVKNILNKDTKDKYKKMIDFE